MTQTKFSRDDLKRIIEDLAENGEGVDRRWALGKLQETEDRQVRLPDPLTTNERHERLVRVMRGAGRHMCQKAWRKLWPTTKIRIDDPALPKDVTLDATDLEIISKVISLKSLYRHFPEIMQPSGGIPTGFPMRGKEVQKDWCQLQARKILIDRKVAKLEERGEEDEPDV